MLVLGTSLSLIFVPSIREANKNEKEPDEKNVGRRVVALRALAKFNPVVVFKPLVYPNVLLPVSPLFFVLTL